MQRKLSGGVQAGWQRAPAGRPTQQRISAGGGTNRLRTYQWQTGDILSQIDDSLTGSVQYQHDDFGALIGAQYGDGSDELRLPDSVGNLYERAAKDDRAYVPGGQLVRSGQTTYHYDEEGNLIRKATPDGKAWYHEWLGNGTLSRVVRPDGEPVSFTYDALGRRLSKTYKGLMTRWVWEGNKPLHEWQELVLDGQPTDAVITWLFEHDSFAPIGKLQVAARHSILTDHLGTPLTIVDQHRQRSWQAQTTAYGRIRLSEGTRAECPFHFQGQYEDSETGLYYNRFRYYAPQEGAYISQDPIRLLGGAELYAYPRDPLVWTDGFGLSRFPKGFKSFGQDRQFAQSVKGQLHKMGYPGVTPLMQGSAVTGVSHDMGKVFDDGRVSDFDIALADKNLYEKATSAGLTKGNGSRVQPIDSDELADMMGIEPTRDKLSKLAGRPVNFMIFPDKEAAKAKAVSMTMPC